MVEHSRNFIAKMHGLATVEANRCFRFIDATMHVRHMPFSRLWMGATTHRQTSGTGTIQASTTDYLFERFLGRKGKKDHRR